jgi:hypothetical protein
MYRHRIRRVPCEEAKLPTASLSALYYYFRHFRLTNRENFCGPCLRSRDPSTTTRVPVATLLSILYHLSRREVAIKVKAKSCLCLIKYRVMKACGVTKYAVEHHYSDISLYDTLSIASDILWYQLMPHC